MDHQKRRERRKRAALYAEIYGLDSAANEFGLSYDTVRLACKENNIIPFKKLNITIFEIIKHLLDGVSPCDIAKKYSVSGQYIYKIRGKCLEAGIKIPQENE